MSSSYKGNGPLEGFSGTIGHYKRPLVQVVVLFASDPRVVAFARTAVAPKFIDAGIDTFLNVRGGAGGGGDGQGGYIRAARNVR